MKNGKVRITHNLIINNELIQQILSFGADIEVLSPEILRDKIKEEIEHLHQFYQ